MNRSLKIQFVLVTFLILLYLFLYKNNRKKQVVYESVSIHKNNFHGYIIHLQRAHDREQNIHEQCEILKRNNVLCKISNAIDAKNVQEFVDFATKYELTNDKLQIEMSASEFACYFSHYKTLLEIYNSRKDYDTIAFIFEDDFFFVQENEHLFQEFLHTHDQFDFDLCFLGTLTNYKGKYINHFFTQIQIHDCGTPFFGTHAYAVRIQSIPFILRNLQHVTRQYDGQIYTISCQHIKTFVTQSNLFNQAYTLPSYIRTQNYVQE